MHLADAGPRALRSALATLAGGSLDDVVNQLLREALALPNVHRAGLALTQGAGRELTFTSLDPYGSGEVERCRLDGLADVPVTRTVRTGTALHLPDVESMRRQYRAFAEGEIAAGSQALSAYPLRHADEVIGGLLLCFSAPKHGLGPRTDELALAERATLALAGARRRVGHGQARARARGPHTLPTAAEVQLGQHHRLCSDADPVGPPGDWAEAIRLTDGRHLLAVGHSRPTGPASVASARAAVRQAVARGVSDPEDVLTRVALSAWERDPSPGAPLAAAVAVLDPIARTVVAATVGGLPVVATGAHSSHTLALPWEKPDLRSGVATAVVQLPEDGLVVLVSDPGLPAVSLASTVDRLAAAVADPLLLALRVGHDPLTRDGCSVLTARLTGRRSAHRVVLDLPHHSTAPGQARRRVGTLLSRWGVDPLVEAAQACVTELCTNAYMHSTSPVRVVLSHEGHRAVILVHNGQVTHLGRRTSPGPDDVGGRGLLLVEAMSDEWGWEVGAEGTTVWCRIDTGGAGAFPSSDGPQGPLARA